MSCRAFGSGVWPLCSGCRGCEAEPEQRRPALAPRPGPQGWCSVGARKASRRQEHSRSHGRSHGGSYGGSLMGLGRGWRGFWAWAFRAAPRHALGGRRLWKRCKPAGGGISKWIRSDFNAAVSACEKDVDTVEQSPGTTWRYVLCLLDEAEKHTRAGLHNFQCSYQYPRRSKMVEEGLGIV